MNLPPPEASTPKFSRQPKASLALAAAMLLPAFASAAPLQHQAYLWQRLWNEPVRQALREQAGEFSKIIVLQGEITFSNGRPRCTRAAIDYPTLAKLRVPVGLALRMGPFQGPFSTNAPLSRFLLATVRSFLTEARSHQLEISEFQIDFDCAESNLEGYRVWVQALRQAVTPVPLTITALPSWLKQPKFKDLVSATDGYVLQVHSLERPRGTDEFKLCDPALARRAVGQAAAFNVPFRVALPTYGYYVAFDHSGRFLGLSAEGPAKNWPADAQVREVRSDPLELARLVQDWSAKHPLSMQGVVWYRLPVKTDTLNWRWPTLRAIVASRLPREDFRAAARRVEPRLTEISLVNNGELDISSRLVIEARWSREGGTRLLAGDALGAFELVDAGSSAVRFQSNKNHRVPAGETLVIGWLRLSADREVSVECKQMQAGSAP